MNPDPQPPPVEAAPDGLRSRRVPRFVWFILGTLAVLSMLVSGVLAGRYDSWSLCPDCARTQLQTDWQIPFTHHTYYCSSIALDSPLSRVLDREHLLAGHEHRWFLVWGRGNGYPIVIGEGNELAGALVTPAAGQFVASLAEHTDPDTVRRWLRRMIDPASSRNCQYISRECAARVFASREQFRDWLQRKEERSR